MLGIEINNGFLDLDPDTQISIRVISPAFHRELKDNSHSLSFSLPGSKHNFLATGYYQSPQVLDAPSTYDATLYLDHNPFLSGKLDITQGGGEGNRLSCKFRFGFSAIVTDLKETKIKDVDLGGQRHITGSAVVSMDLEITQLIPDEIAAIRINGYLFIFPFNTGMTEEDLLNEIATQINLNTGIHVTATVNGVGNNATITLDTDPGFTQLDVDINDPINQQQWDILSQGGQAIAIHDAVITHMNTVVQAPAGTYDYTFITTLNTKFYDGLNPDFHGYVNLWDWNGLTFVKNTSAAGEAWQNTAVPFPRLAYLLDQGFAHLGFTNISTFTASADFQKIHLWNNRSLDQVRNDGVGDFNGFQSYIDLKDHIPEDLTLADLVVYIRNTFNLIMKVDYQAKEVDFVRINDIPNNQELDWREKTLAGYSIKRKPEHQRGIYFSYQKDGKDDMASYVHSTRLPDYSTGAGHKKITSKISPMFVMPGYVNPVSGGRWRIPEIRQVGQTPYPEVEADEYNLRTILFQGMQEGGVAGKTYPMGENQAQDYNYNPLGNWGLKFHNPSDPADPTTILAVLYEPLLSDTIEEAELDQLLLLNRLDLLEMNELLPVRTRTNEGEIRSIIRQMRITINMHGIVSSVANLLRL